MASSGFMTPEEERQAAWRNAAAGSRDAAEWALKLIGGFENQGSAAAAMSFLKHLQGLSLDRQVVTLVQMVNLVGRTGVASPDVATLLVKLRMMTTMEVPGEESS